MNMLSTKKYAFVLGRERELCFAELKAVLKRFCFDFVVSSVTDNIVFINIADHKDSESNEYTDYECADITNNVPGLVDVLGGTIKIFLIIDEGNFKGRNDALKSKIIEYLRKKSGKKINYGISSYTKYFTRNFVNNIGLSIKKDLKREMSLRFVALRDGDELSSIVSLKGKLAFEGAEFGLFDQGIGILLGVSNAEEWGKRDYDKPAGDKRSGMLPPKVARMMINLALGQFSGKCQSPNYLMPNKITKDQKPNAKLEIRNSDLEIDECPTLVLDPFCGSGNILTEAMMLGCDAFGSDISARAVEDSKANLEWLAGQKSGVGSQEYLAPDTKRPTPNFAIVQANATEFDFADCLSTLYSLPSTDLVIVTEPFLGEPKKIQPTMNAVRGEYRQIKEMYLSFLSNLSHLSDLVSKKPKAFCIVFPLVETIDKGRFSLYRDSVDEIRKIGYTELQPPLVYGRDYQVVKRQICLLQSPITKIQ